MSWTKTYSKPLEEGTVRINTVRVRQILKNKNCTTLELGKCPDIDWEENPIRSYIRKGMMPPKLIEQIASYVGVTPRELINPQKEGEDVL